MVGCIAAVGEEGLSRSWLATHTISHDLWHTLQVYETIDKLQEVNPMLGFRGCRLGITYPEITEMQVGGCDGVTLAGPGVTKEVRGRELHDCGR